MDMAEKVPEILTVIFVINILIGIAIPTVLFIVFKKKYGCSFVPFLIGVGTFFLFSSVLESLVHTAVTLLFPGIPDNIPAYAVYGGLMAGLFEETGRFLAMKFLLKKFYGNDRNALMYGAGHGGFEAFMILSSVSLNNLIFSAMINTGMEQTILESAPNEALAEQVRTIFDELKTADPAVFLVAPAERLFAVTFHIALSVLVWFAVTRKGKIWYYPLAVGLHAVYDTLLVIIYKYTDSVLLTELIAAAGAAVSCILAYRVYKANTVPAAAKETADHTLTGDN